MYDNTKLALTPLLPNLCVFEKVVPGIVFFKIDFFFFLFNLIWLIPVF